MSTFRLAPLAELLVHDQNYVGQLEDRQYRKLSVKLYGKGVTLDAPVDGMLVKMKRHQLARPGQVILSEIWGKKGAIGFVPPEGDGALCTSHFFLFDVKTEKVDPRWLAIIFKGNYLEEQLNAKAFGTTGYASIRPGTLLACTIPLPPLAEQRRLVARIEALAGLIAEAQALRKEAVVEAEALIIARVSAIDEALRSSHPTRLLETLARSGKGAYRSGPFGSDLLHGEFVESGVLAAGIQNVLTNKFDTSKTWYVSEAKAKELERFEVYPNDLLVTVMGTLGRTCVVPEGLGRMISTKHIWTLTLNHMKADPRWVSYWINYSRIVRKELLGRGTGTAIAGLNGGKLRAINLPDIDLPTQRRIVRELDALQAEVDALKRLQAETQAELDALLPAVLEGVFKQDQTKAYPKQDVELSMAAEPIRAKK